MDEKEISTFIKSYNLELLTIIEEFFINATGCTYNKFSPIDGFENAIHRIGESFNRNIEKMKKHLNSYVLLEQKLKKFYNEKGKQAFLIAKSYKGYKLIHGGSSRFVESHVNATKRALLYSDMVLIPDPVLPWLESNRSEEKFKNVLLLQSVFFLLHLKNIASIDTDVPPIFIFPSWEKSLETHDEQTSENSKQLITDIFSFYIDDGIHNFDELNEYINRHENDFLHRVEQNRLLISPGGEIGGPLKNEVENYKKYHAEWKSDQWNGWLSKLSDAELVFYLLCERIQPLYHLLENSIELNSNPFLCIKNQAHYFQLITSMSNSRLTKYGVIDDKTSGIINALMSNRLDFLANIDEEMICKLRKENENIEFRRQLRDVVNSLPETQIKDIGYISSEVCSHIDLLITKYKKDVNEIKNKYQTKYKYDLLIAAGGLAVTFVPALVPFIGTSIPIAIASGGKYISEKFDERNELKMISNSMVGVFAIAKQKQSK